MSNYLTATQFAEKITQRINKKINTSKIQQALLNLGYVRKRGKKYMPTIEKGSYYCIERKKQFGNIIKSYYLWNVSLMYEIEEVILGEYII